MAVCNGRGNKNASTSGPGGVRGIFPGGKCSESADFELGIRWPPSSEQLAGRAQLSRACAEEDAEEWHRLPLIWTRQSAGAGNEEYISEFASCCLMESKLDEWTKVTLFIEGLFDTQIRRK